MLRALWVMIKLPLLTGLLVIIIFGTFYWDRKHRRIFDWCMRWWSRGWLRAAGVKPVIIGQEIVDRFQGRPFWLVGNHQSALDIPVVISASHGRVRFAAKKILFSIPFVGRIMRLQGFTPIDRSDARKTMPELDKMLERLEHSTSAQVIFPEGTRSATGELFPFKMGSFRLIERTRLPVVPFVIDGTWKVQHRSTLIISPGQVSIRFCEPILPDPDRPYTRDDLLARVRTECLKYLPEHKEPKTVAKSGSSPNPRP